ncbi:MAG: hypothetical protein JWQ43_2726 [Glaciihabitans sp.]|nr:hypothetical protein [Glaciihabitans sp.]
MALALSGSVVLVGCAAAVTPVGSAPEPATPSTLSPTSAIGPSNESSCGITVSPEIAVLGDTVRITRGPAEPCHNVTPGSTQYFFVDSSNETASTGSESASIRSESVQLGEVDVADDGSFELTVIVPDVLPAGRTWLSAITDPTFPCEALAGYTVVCDGPAVSVTLVIPPGE